MLNGSKVCKERQRTRLVRQKKSDIGKFYEAMFYFKRTFGVSGILDVLNFRFCLGRHDITNPIVSYFILVVLFLDFHFRRQIVQSSKYLIYL